MAEEKILVVDDDGAIRTACVRCLKTGGYDVQDAESGERAIEIMKSEQFRVVITDLIMPGISGIDLLRHIKTNYPHCDVIIITSFPSVETSIEALRLGVYDYITKPFDINEFREKVKKCLAEQSVGKPEEKEEVVDNIFTTYEASKHCGVTLATVINWVEHGILPAYKTPGGHRRIKKEDLIEFLKKYNMPIPDKLK